VIAPVSSVRRFACLALCAGTVMAIPSGDGRRPQIDAAYYAGQEVSFTVVMPASSRRMARVGPWLYGVRLRDSRPSDRRRNLYLVFPGSQHQARGWQDYDHDCILSGLPHSDEPTEWDVWWAVVLDPSLRDDFRDERELIHETESTFVPPDLMDFDDVPGQRFLRAGLKIDSVAGLARFRHKDGTLPRVVIVPAGFAIRAIAQMPEPEDQSAADQR
jgi:hypothetical protein